eukprot:CAMPEP_0195526588 /NCGR_PEP_ID=MMETSP0794_2-20130614/27744_1 /TAXON_ID=515487 /ORGANISM="Stephanopyxis turris, Strain CCMP 815" /LENGTH=303 /DNA_ID=CAMNT_0040657315 /DNA_START=285 /DNA_END=1193 /DNA_ORIENTATION=+
MKDCEGQTLSAKEEKVNSKKELAVCITGCDSGFGRDLSFALSERGFTVFAGCLTEDGLLQYQDVPSIFPLKMDVTKENDTTKSFDVISKWLSDPSAKLQRFLHALINNAGLGTAGLIDWIEISDFQRDMEVNYFGMVRVIKTFLPILKAQACAAIHVNARIINVVSMAGLISNSGVSAYHASKHAAEAFSTSLRLELKSFNLAVVTVNPSFHKTPLVDHDTLSRKFKQLWDSIGQDLQCQYGKEYYDHFCNTIVENTTCLLWDANVVIDKLISCVELVIPPPQVVVGTDAKFFLLGLRHLPVW